VRSILSCKKKWFGKYFFDLKKKSSFFIFFMLGKNKYLKIYINFVYLIKSNCDKIAVEYIYLLYISRLRVWYQILFFFRKIS